MSNTCVATIYSSFFSDESSILSDDQSFWRWIISKGSDVKYATGGSQLVEPQLEPTMILLIMKSQQRIFSTKLFLP